jgi:hypothetical protein
MFFFGIKFVLGMAAGLLLLWLGFLFIVATWTAGRIIVMALIGTVKEEVSLIAKGLRWCVSSVLRTHR